MRNTDPQKYSISAVIPTKNRTVELVRVLSSLREQTLKVREVLIIDQNEDDILDDVLRLFSDLNIIRHRTPHLIGVNRNRNFGLKHCVGDLIIFPDDDCWYPSDFFEKAISILEATGADCVFGRPTDVSGRTINGRFRNYPCWIDRKSVWFTQIEWAFISKVKALREISGFEVKLGTGSQTPWGSCEIQDLSLRLIGKKYQLYYDPNLIAHHPKVTISKSNGDWYKRVPIYAKGMGYVLAEHNYSWISAITWCARPALKSLLYTAKLDFWSAKLKISTSWNRMLGYSIRRREIQSKKNG